MTHYSNKKRVKKNVNKVVCYIEGGKKRKETSLHVINV
jgi:hypothetical protein